VAIQRKTLLLALLIGSPMWGADYFLYAGTYTTKSSKASTPGDFSPIPAS